MKHVIIAAAATAVLAFAAPSASQAAPLVQKNHLATSSNVTDVACRIVKKTVWKNGRKRVVTTRNCGGARYYKHGRVYKHGRWHHRRDPGVHLGIRVR